MSVIFDPQSKRQVDRVIALLKAGDVVGLPTETVYGLAGSALNEASLAKIFALKNRPTFDPLIVHVLNQREWIAPLVKNQRVLHQKLMEAFWPGPLTLLFEKSEKISDLCTASTPWVALRAPAHPLFQKVLTGLGEPLAAPSANRFGRISPTQAEDVVKELGPFGLSAVLDGGPCQHGIESTVVKVISDEEVEVLRLGALSMEDLKECLGRHVRLSIRKSGSGIEEKHEAPGLLKSHYAPRTPLWIWDDLNEAQKQSLRNKRLKYGFLSVFPFEGASAAQAWGAFETLSEQGSSVEAASKLFQVLRRMDELGVSEKIEAIVVKIPTDSQSGLCPAILDRLRRASSIFPPEL